MLDTSASIATNCVAVEKENSMCHPVSFLHDVERMGAIKISISLNQKTKHRCGSSPSAISTHVGFSQLRTHVRRHVSFPESQSGPVEIQEEGGVMLPKT